MDPWNPYERQICGKCGVREGQLHELGCGMERCPFCGGQLISCACAERFLDLYDPGCYGPETGHIPPEVYEKGLSAADETRWIGMLDARGRVPYICYPNMCGRCGEC